jgi:nitrile hydratase accessory protein
VKTEDLEGVPRKNGELVFEAPWQSRAFGLAVAMSESGAYAWDDFREHLIAEIGEQPQREYYANWLEAFEHLLVEDGVLDQAELERRTREYVSMERDEVF